jgi:hypothetical protein
VQALMTPFDCRRMQMGVNNRILGAQLKTLSIPANPLPRKSASRRGAPLGNKNAIGNSGNWYPRGNFVTRHLISKLLANSAYSAPQRAKLLRKLAERLFDSALAGEMSAIKEIFMRVEGPPRKARPEKDDR